MDIKGIDLDNLPLQKNSNWNMNCALYSDSIIKDKTKISLIIMGPIVKSISYS